MDSLTWYMGKNIVRSVQEDGRDPKMESFLAAVVIKARQENLSVDYLHRLVDEFYVYEYARQTQEQNLKDLGF